MPPRRKPRASRRKPRVVRRRRIRRAPAVDGFTLTRSVPVMALKCLISGAATSTNTDIFNVGAAISSPNALSSTYDVPFSFQFKLNQLQNYSEISNICDKYKIIRAQVLISGYNANPMGNAANLPYIEYEVDHNDASVPSISEIDQINRLKTRGFNQRGQMTLTCSTVPVDQVYNAASVTSAYATPNRPQFIDSLYTGVPHYGIRGVIRNLFLNGSTSNNSSPLSIRVRMTVVARNLQ